MRTILLNKIQDPKFELDSKLPSNSLDNSKQKVSYEEALKKTSQIRSPGKRKEIRSLTEALRDLNREFDNIMLDIKYGGSRRVSKILDTGELFELLANAGLWWGDKKDGLEAAKAFFKEVERGYAVDLDADNDVDLNDLLIVLKTPNLKLFHGMDLNSKKAFDYISKKDGFTEEEYLFARDNPNSAFAQGILENKNFIEDISQRKDNMVLWAYEYLDTVLGKGIIKILIGLEPTDKKPNGKDPLSLEEIKSKDRLYDFIPSQIEYAQKNPHTVYGIIVNFKIKKIKELEDIENDIQRVSNIILGSSSGSKDRKAYEKELERLKIIETNLKGLLANF